MNIFKVKYAYAISVCTNMYIYSIGIKIVAMTISYSTVAMQPFCFSFRNVFRTFRSIYIYVYINICIF